MLRVCDLINININILCDHINIKLLHNKYLRVCDLININIFCDHININIFAQHTLILAAHH